MVEVRLGKYKGLKVKKNKIKVEKEEIKKSLDYLQNSRAKIITVNRPCKKGDRAEVDFEVRQGGVKIENGQSKNHPLILGQGRFIPGFEEKLEGMQAGEEKEFSLRAPADWLNPGIANKNLDFKVKMNLVQERELPAIDDKFAKSLGNFDSLTNLKQNIKEGLLQEKEIKEEQKIRIELVEKVVQNSEMKVPEELIKKELERMVNEFKTNLNNLGLDFDRYLKETRKTIEDLKKNWQEQAKKKVSIALCLQVIAERENIKVSDEEVKERINQDLKHYPNIEEIKKNIDFNKLKEYTRSILRDEKVFGLLEKEAKII